MHYLITLIYGCTVWISLLALAVITQTGLAMLTFLAGPVIISAAMVVLMVLDAAIAKLWG